MPQKGQATVTVKKELIDQVKAQIEEIKKKAIPTSVAEFVSMAVQEKLERLKKEGVDANGQ
jgi:hypothetical protein